MLCDIANILLTQSRKQDVISRWGGEGFLILLPENVIQGGEFLSEKTREHLERKTFNYLSLSILITMSFDLSQFQTDDIGVDACIKRAGKALYNSKRNGINKVTVNHPR